MIYNNIRLSRGFLETSHGLAWTANINNLKQQSLRIWNRSHQPHIFELNSGCQVHNCLSIVSSYTKTVPVYNICWLRQPVGTLSGCLRNSIRSGSETAAGLRNQFQNSAKTQLEVCKAFAKPALCVQWCWSGILTPSTLKNMLTYNLGDWHFVTVPPGTQLPELKAGKVVVVRLLSDFGSSSVVARPLTG